MKSGALSPADPIVIIGHANQDVIAVGKGSQRDREGMLQGDSESRLIWRLRITVDCGSASIQLVRLREVFYLLKNDGATCRVVAEGDLWGRSSKSEAPSLKRHPLRLRRINFQFRLVRVRRCFDGSLSNRLAGGSHRQGQRSL